MAPPPRLVRRALVVPPPRLHLTGSTTVGVRAGGSPRRATRTAGHRCTSCSKRGSHPGRGAAPAAERLHGRCRSTERGSRRLKRLPRRQSREVAFCRGECEIRDGTRCLLRKRRNDRGIHSGSSSSSQARGRGKAGAGPSRWAARGRACHRLTPRQAFTPPCSLSWIFNAGPPGAVRHGTGLQVMFVLPTDVSSRAPRHRTRCGPLSASSSAASARTTNDANCSPKASGAHCTEWLSCPTAAASPERQEERFSFLVARITGTRRADHASRSDSKAPRIRAEPPARSVT